MCGIAGIYGAFDEKVVKEMLLSQSHRGPDGEGIWGVEDQLITLGHVRLSIIDTSSAGHQPMSYANERFWITYNGEIYNYEELRRELILEGCKFHSNTDTEVILAAYNIWGVDFVKRLRGMFAFALFDKAPSSGSPNLILVRDRLGVKPLLYFNKNNKLYFASELRALMSTGCIDKAINRESLLDYFTVGAIYQPNTIIEGIKSIPSGHYLEIYKNEQRLTKYWDLHEATIGLRTDLIDINYEEAVIRLKELLHKATHYNLVSDVKVGAFLSGGIDSTAVVGLMSSESGQSINTFAVGFENEYNTIDERKYARIAADHLNCNHEDVIITTEQAGTFFDKIINDIDQPSIDGTNTWLVSRAACKSLKVSLSGLGGDEIFAGYSHFYRIAEDKTSFFTGQKILFQIVERLHKIRPNFLTLRFLSKVSTSVERLSTLRRVLENFELEDAIQPKWISSFRNRINDRHKSWVLKDADVVQQTTYTEIMGYLQSTLLRDCDVMSMAHGLEVRPVLLDHELVEFVYSLPMSLKLTKEQSKKLFIDSVGDLIPNELKNRSKMGFELPSIEWMAGPLKVKFETLYRNRIANKLFTQSFIDNQIKALNNSKPTRSTWAFGILIAWLDKYNVELSEK